MSIWRLVFVHFLVLLSWNTFAQGVTEPASDSFDIKKSSFLLPQALPPGKYSHAFSVYWAVIPKDWALDIIQAPLFTYSAKYTLPAGFNVQGSWTTLFISNRLFAGPYWNHSFGNYHVGAGWQIAYNFGFLREFGYNMKVTGWETQPSFTAGYSFKKSAIILRSDLYFKQTFTVNTGGNEIKNTGRAFNGLSVTGTLEQRLWKDRIFGFGIKVNYVRYYFMAWPAFPVNKYKYYVPEFQMTLKF